MCIRDSHLILWDAGYVGCLDIEADGAQRLGDSVDLGRLGDDRDLAVLAADIGRAGLDRLQLDLVRILVACDDDDLTDGVELPANGASLAQRAAVAIERLADLSLIHI